MNIAERITTALTDIVDLYYSVAETDVAPYAVYSLEYSESRTKEGPYKYTADVVIAVVGNNYAQADRLSKQVMSAIDGIRNTDLSVRLESHSEDSEKDAWVIQNRYIIIQLI